MRSITNGFFEAKVVKINSLFGFEGLNLQKELHLEN